MTKEFVVLLFFKYINIDNPSQLRVEMINLANKYNLKGRCIVAKEGINFTLEGEKIDTENYLSELKKDPRFNDIHIKKSIGDGQSFPKLQIKVRDEIVTLGLKNVDPTVMTGKPITSEELYSWFESGKKFYIIDMRNDYEHEVGAFIGSLFPKIRNFRELPSVIKDFEHLKNETIVTVCTGQVRCEKASTLLMKYGFTDVYKLYGGIHTFMEKYPGKFFEGKLYVFDNRLTIEFGGQNAVTKCRLCQKITDNFTNCKDIECHYHFVACEECLEKADGNLFCKPSCEQAVRERFKNNIS
jgi:UPF0176 protein